MYQVYITLFNAVYALLGPLSYLLKFEFLRERDGPKVCTLPTVTLLKMARTKNIYKYIFHGKLSKYVKIKAMQTYQNQDPIFSPLSGKNTISFCSIWAIFGRKQDQVTR